MTLPESPNSLLHTLAISHGFVSIQWKNCILLVVFCNLQGYNFACRIVALWLLRLNIKARQDIPEFLNANLGLIDLFAFKKNAWIDRSFCIGFFSYFIFLLRDQWMFERLGKANWWGFGQGQLLANSIISHEKRGDLLLPYIYKAIKPFWLSNWVSLARVVACFPKVSLSLPAAPAADSKTPCVCASPSDQPKLCWSAAPSAWPLILQSKSSIVFSNSLLEWLPDDQHGLKLGLKLELCLLTNWLYKFYLFWNPRIKFNKLCGVWILFRTPKLRAAYQSSITRLHSTVTVIGVYFHFTDVLLNAHWAALWPQQYQLSPTRLHSTVIGVEIFSLHRCFAQCSLSSSLTSEKC